MLFLYKKLKSIVAKSEIYEIGEKLIIDEFESNLVNNVIRKPYQFGESSRSTTYFIGPEYAITGEQPTFFFWFIPKKRTFFE